MKAANWIDDRPRIVLAFILVLALVIRLAAIGATSDYQPIYDSGDYDRHARSIAEGHGFPDAAVGEAQGPSAFRPPVYPYVLGAVYWLAGEDSGVDAARVFDALLGVAVVFLIFLLARELNDTRTGLIAAGIAAVFPPLALIHLALISEPVFLVLELSAFICALKSRSSPGLGWPVAVGLLCGLAALTRGNGALLVLALAAGVWIGKPRFTRSALAPPIVVVIAAAAVVLPWTVRNAVDFHKLIPVTTQNGYGLAGTFNDEARADSTWVAPDVTDRYGGLLTRSDVDEAQLDAELRSRVWDYAVDHPTMVPKAIVANTLRVFGVTSLGEEETVGDQQQLGLGPRLYSLVRWSFLFLAVLALASLVYLRRRAIDRFPPLFLLVSPALLVLAAVWVLGNTRYRVPFDPIVVVIVAAALGTVISPRLGPLRDDAAPAASGSS